MATTPTTTTPPSTPITYGPLNIDYLNESWCDLQYKSGCSSTGSISHLNHSVNPEVLEKLLQEAQKESQSPLPAAPPLPIIQSFDSFSAVLSSSSHKDNASRETSKSSNTASEGSNSAASNVISMSSSRVKSDRVFKPINGGVRKVSNKPPNTIYVYENEYYDNNDEYDDEVDLEYVEEDSEDSDAQIKAFCDNATNNTFTEASQLLTTEKISQMSASAKPPQPTCTLCQKQKKEINALIEKQLSQEKELIRLRNDYEIKLLNKSLELCQSSASSSSGKSKFMTSSPSPLSPPSLASNSGMNTPIFHTKNSSNSAHHTNQAIKTENANDQAATMNTKDYMKYFASRPQSQPPKEWNFVHPNSKSAILVNKLAAVQYEDSSAVAVAGKVNNAVLSKGSVSLSNLIFTHVASFIVGATLMFLVLRRHMNMKGTIYFI